MTLRLTTFVNYCTLVIVLSTKGYQVIYYFSFLNRLVSDMIQKRVIIISGKASIESANGAGESEESKSGTFIM